MEFKVFLALDKFLSWGSDLKRTTKITEIIICIDKYYVGCNLIRSPNKFKKTKKNIIRTFNNNSSDLYIKYCSDDIYDYVEQHCKYICNLNSQDLLKIKFNETIRTRIKYIFNTYRSHIYKHKLPKEKSSIEYLKRYHGRKK